MAEQPPGIAAPAKLLLAVFDAHDEWQGEPLHEAIVRVLETHGIAGVTVLQGLTGFGAHRAVHRRGLIGLPHDKPTVMLIVENEAKLRAVLPTIRPMIAQGIVVLTEAEVIPPRMTSRAQIRMTWPLGRHARTRGALERTLAVLCRSHPVRESARDSRKL